MQPLRKFLILPAPDKRMLLEAVLGLLLARLSVRAIPFRFIHAFLRGRAPSAGGDNPVRDIKAIETALWRAERVFSRQRRCLPRAIAAFVMLRRRGYQPTLSLGLRPERGPLPFAA